MVVVVVVILNVIVIILQILANPEKGIMLSQTLNNAGFYLFFSLHYVHSCQLCSTVASLWHTRAVPFFC